MRMLLLALALAAAPAAAKTLDVPAGPDAQRRLQEALILAEPGDVVQIGPGRFELTDGLSLDVNKVTVRGAGIDSTVLDFAGQQGAGQGLLVTGDDVTLRDFAILNPRGDGFKSKGADRIVYHRVRAEWTGGPKESNGAYGIYPVESTGVLIDGAVAIGASDAGIYVGQSRAITVRNSIAQGNVAGIEIENSRNAIVRSNFVTRNTGGILVFDLPGLPVKGGGDVLVEDNLVVGNDTPNFAPKGNIVASVRRGTGIMVMANDAVTVRGNRIDGNPTSAAMVIAYPLAYDDKSYNPLPRGVVVAGNVLGRNGYDPQFPNAAALLAAFGGALPPLLWDGLGPPAATLAAAPGIAAWSLNLGAPGADFATARPARVKLAAPGEMVRPLPSGAPAELDARLGP